MSGRQHEPTMPDALAYFLTWPTYGTWLPGDERGWVEYKTGWKLPDSIRKLEAAARMSEHPCILDFAQRQTVQDVIQAHCQVRGWHLFAVNCRTNHLHVVVAAPCSPKAVQAQFKAWCTRRLKELELSRQSNAGEEIRSEWWAERGSRRWINDEESLECAVRYVLEGQDAPRLAE